MFSSLAVNRKAFRKQCWYVLFSWLLCTFSTALLAAMPGVEQRDGYIALCTAQGIKWIPIESVSSDISSVLSQLDIETPDTVSTSSIPSVENATPFHKQASQHCTACVLSTDGDVKFDIVASTSNFTVTVNQLAVLNSDHTNIFQPDKYFPSFKPSRAPPSIL